MLPVLTALAALAGPLSDCPPLTGSPLDGEPGARKLALIVGVGDYLARFGGKDQDLEGPPRDARHVRDLFVKQFGFSVQNVCLLVDADATIANHARAWREHLERAQSGDVVSYYFAGHGSQVPDQAPAMDESDGKDETLVFHDSFVNDTLDLVDDDLNWMIHRVYEKTRNISVILDSCNSGTGSRGAAKARGINRPDAPFGVVDALPPEMPEVVRLGAARDGTLAVEFGGDGLFTDALLDALRWEQGQSWRDVVARVPSLLQGRLTNQIPTFEGQLDRQALGSGMVTERAAPGSWRVTLPGRRELKLTGPPLPGWSRGARVEIRDPSSGARKAIARIDGTRLLEADATVLRRRRRVKQGDVVTLRRAGVEQARVGVYVDPSIPLAGALGQTLTSHGELRGSLMLANPDQAYMRVVPSPTDGLVEIRDMRGALRNTQALGTAADVNEVAYTLALHARQALLLRHAQVHRSAYAKGSIIEARVISAPDTGTAQACPLVPFEPIDLPLSQVDVPMCNAVQIEVRLIDDPVLPLHIGVLYLGSDGEIDLLHDPRRDTSLAAAGDHLEVTYGWVAPPMHQIDSVVVFGSHEPVRWERVKARALPDDRGRDDGIDAALDEILARTDRSLDTKDIDKALDFGWTSATVRVLPVTSHGWTSEDLNNAQLCTQRHRQFQARGRCFGEDSP